MDDDPWPRHHTRVRVRDLGAAIDATQAILYARTVRYVDGDSCGHLVWLE
jgi:hypothetical protein